MYIEMTNFQSLNKRHNDTQHRSQLLLLRYNLNRWECFTIYENSYPICCRRKGFPKGKIKTNENKLQALFREVKEEIGIIMNTKHLHTLYYINVNAHKTTYSTFISVHNIDENDIILGDEVISYEWVSIDEVNEKNNFNLPAILAIKKLKKIYNL